MHVVRFFLLKVDVILNSSVDRLLSTPLLLPYICPDAAFHLASVVVAAFVDCER